MPEDQFAPILSHAAGGMFVQNGTDGKLDILAFSYRKGGRSTLRIPVGTGTTGESLTATLRREMREEVARPDHEFDFTLVFPTPVYWERVEDDDTRQPTHLKAFFALAISRGQIREKERIDQQGMASEERLGPPYWYDAADLLFHMSQERSPRVHQFAVAAALRSFARITPSTRAHYSRVLRYWDRHNDRFDLADPVVAEYVSRA